MNKKAVLLAFATLLTLSTVSAQVSPELEERLDQRPDTERVDVIILTQSNANEQAKSAVRNANGNVNHDFSIIDGVAVTIPKVAAENLANREFVREVQPDFNVETRVSESTGSINADEVWSKNTTGEGVDVAVIDTGIEDNTILNVEDQVDYTGEGTDDLNGHGTHVAGILASPDEEYQGVAYGSDLFDVKVLEEDGTGSASDVIAGLEWAADNNLDIATLSLGAEVDSCDGTSSISEAVDNTVEDGVTVTVAAGNQGPESETITAPGCSEKGITVGSSGNGEISDFSSRGPTADGRVKPDLVAPGEGITSLTNNEGESPQFETLSGTSIATPHVAGAAALLLAEEDLTPAEVKNITTYTAEDLGFDENNQGAGRLDAYAAYQQVAPTDQTENETENETGNHPPTVEALETQVTRLNQSAEAELEINATDEDNETLNATFYLEGEEVSQQEGYGEITHLATNLSVNTTYNWSAEVTDGINMTSTGTQSFNTDTGTDEENETEEDNETVNETKPALPEQASDTARKARAGFFNPNSLFYGFDVAFDRVSVAIGLKTRESVMEERAQEAKVMAERGNNKAAEKAVKQLRKTAGESENATREVGEILNRTMKGEPEEAKQGVQNALKNVENQREERRNQQRPDTSRERQERTDQTGGPEKPPQDKSPETGAQKPQQGETENLSERQDSQDKQRNSQTGQDTTSQERREDKGKGTEGGANARADADTGKDEKSVEGGAEAEADVGVNLDTEESSETTGNSGTTDRGQTSSSKSPENSGSTGGERSNPSGNPNAGGPVGNFFEALLG